jgi:hypothetical protein
MAERSGEGAAGSASGVGGETPQAKVAEKLPKELEKPVIGKEFKPEFKEGKPEIKEGKLEGKEGKPEIKEGKFEGKEGKPEIKEHKDVKPEFKEHKDVKPEFKEQKNEFKEHKPEIKESKLEKHELKEIKVEFEKQPKGEIKEIEKQTPEKLPGKELVEGPQGPGGGDPGPLGGLSREALEAHAAALEQAAQEVRHFIEQSDRPDTGGGALANEPDQPSGG